MRIVLKRQFPSIERRRALFLPKSAKADLRLLTLTGSSRRRVHDGGKCRCSNILDTLCSSQYAQYPHTPPPCAQYQFHPILISSILFMYPIQNILALYSIANIETQLTPPFGVKCMLGPPQLPFLSSTA